MAGTNEFGLSTIEQIAVKAHDIERAADFYREKLGMKHLFSVPPNLAFFDCDGIRSPQFDNLFQRRRHPGGVRHAFQTRSEV
jgi:catechol 2,3-dioxygenase-like lactoylglutathione lyase family enzyme